MDKLDIKYIRPDDYYAEMVKSDRHMQRIRDALVFETRKMEAFEQRKRNQNMRKIGRQQRSEKIKQKSAEKRAAIDAFKQMRKRRRGQHVEDGGASLQRDFEVQVAAEQQMPHKQTQNQKHKHKQKQKQKQKQKRAGKQRRMANRNKSK